MTTKSKILLVIIDGLGDCEIPSLKKTPLQYSDTPNLNYLAKHGLNGLIDSVEPGLACGSDTAHLSLLGYDPREYYTGRGSFEAIGAGINMKAGEIAFKCNFATLDSKSNLVIKRRASRNFEEIGPVLCDYLKQNIKFENKEYDFEIKYATEHRCAISISGSNLSSKITGTDPLKDELEHVMCKPLDKSLKAQLTSNIVNELSLKIMQQLRHHEINIKREKEHKNVANCILFRGCGMLLNAPSFKEKHGLNGFVIAPTCIISGLAKSIGLEDVLVPGATGDYKSNFENKFKKAIELLQDDKYNFGLVHMKAVDDTGHDKNLDLKLDFINKIDNDLNILLQGFENTNNILCITSDHSTPVLYGDHSCEPSPILITRFDLNHNLRDCVDKFDEISCAAGKLGRLCGIDLIDLLKKLTEYK